MAFEAFPRETFQAYEDHGMFYVHERGKLRSPPGMASETMSTVDLAASRQSSPVINGIFLSNRHQTVTEESCYDGPTRKIYRPKKLFHISLMFVADNVCLVESFAGFPEIVGEQLFNTAMELGKFGDYQTALTALRLFYEAYGSAVLNRLSLRDAHTVLSEHLDCVLMFTGLTALDLGGCAVGNDHEILAVIGNMFSLQELCLCDNGLSDVSIQKMTTPLRVLKRGPRNLQALDLAGNALVTDSAVKYLSAFTSLAVLDLSGCGISGIAHIQSRMPSLRAADTDERRSQFPITIHNRGWAVPLVHSWLCGSKPILAKRWTPKTKSRASIFYGRLSPILPPAFAESDIKKKNPIIQLVSDIKVSGADGDLRPPSKKIKILPWQSEANSIEAYSISSLDTLKNRVKLGVEQQVPVKRKSKHIVSRLKQKRTRTVHEQFNTKSILSGCAANDKVEEPDDLMQSYLLARSTDDGCGTRGSLLGAMNSPGW